MVVIPRLELLNSGPSPFPLLDSFSATENSNNLCQVSCYPPTSTDNFSLPKPWKISPVAWDWRHLVYFKKMKRWTHFSMAYLQSQGQSAGPHPALGGGNFCPLEPESSWKPWSHSCFQRALAHSLQWPPLWQTADNLGPWHS